LGRIVELCNSSHKDAGAEKNKKDASEQR